MDIFLYSEASLIQTPHIRNSHISGHMFGNKLTFVAIKGFTYPEIQLSGQSAWEWMCLDK